MPLTDYERVVGKQVVDQLRKDAEPLRGKHVIHVNSTQTGGGVAEMLVSLLPLMNELGIKTGWRVLRGNSDFFNVTKRFHNGLQGQKDIQLSPGKKRIYESVNKSFSSFTHIDSADCLIIHDPQPLPLIMYYRKRQPWVWRCHIDLSNPNKELWNYLKPFIGHYDRMIVSKTSFKQNISVTQEIIRPSIDPLSRKNKDLPDSRIKRELRNHNIPTDKPIIAQVSRFDKWKDPLGVIESYKIVKKKVDCRLVLLGSMASDDPEGQGIFKQVLEASRDDKDIIVINYESDVLVNALQRTAAVVIQKSLREGFGLTVAEALWKGTPVVASNVGGIGLQVTNGVHGYLVDSPQTCARAVTRLLKNPRLAKKMGAAGKEHIRKNFLITRHLNDYVNLLKKTIIHYKV